MIPTCSSDQKFLSLQVRCRGGSLPLKKRRFSMVSEHAVVPYDGDNICFSEDKLAALSLIASTAAAVEAHMEESPVPESPSLDFSEDQNTDPEDKSVSSESSKRVPSAPLDHPRRGACHGRTSRNNSYCKRQPCYKGSQFCKLHYQQHVLAETSQKVQEDDSSLCKQTSASPSPSIGDKKQGSFQDKRFTGNSGEIRCKATTTRGRECAYIAVTCSKYCFLHADYDNNPPPRRGGASSFKKTPSTPTAQTMGLPDIPDRISIVELQPTLSFSSESAPSVITHSTQELALVIPKVDGEKSKRRGSSAKIARKHLDSPFPLLSMISTDQWAKKRVKISVGPLSDRVGTVEKWSNGWVSVLVDGAGLHNRRSFELCLLQDEETHPAQVKPSVSPSCLGKSEESSCDASRITLSPSVASDNIASIKPIQHAVKPSLKFLVTPYPSPNGKDWPVTPAASSDPPLVPQVTPNTPRKAMCASRDKDVTCGMDEGIFLSDTGNDRETTLHLRLGALQQPIGGPTAVTTHRCGTATTD